ncbi:MAG: carotenoid biosynthesis protein [Legionella sp.]|nr:MAG: carotenoid biosynthesis protein [Legionella sp.]
MENSEINTHFNIMRWIIITIFLIITLISALCQTPFITEISPAITVIGLFAAVWLHGLARYGWKNMVVLFLITWVISNLFEALSIQTGFPFGFYYYDKLLGPRLFNVPIIIILAYFATGYASWILSTILLGQYQKPLQGKHIFLIPFITTFIMVMWDLCMDPLCSTVASLWVWSNGGPYFGVPLQNYFGWFLVVFLIYQTFALFIARKESHTPARNALFTSRWFWMEIVVLYAIQGLTQVVQFIGAQSHYDIYANMALVSIFTMIFVAILACIRIEDEKELV